MALSPLPGSTFHLCATETKIDFMFRGHLWHITNPLVVEVKGKSPASPHRCHSTFCKANVKSHFRLSKIYFASLRTKTESHPFRTRPHLLTDSETKTRFVSPYFAELQFGCRDCYRNFPATTDVILQVAKSSPSGMGKEVFCYRSLAATLICYRVIF